MAAARSTRLVVPGRKGLRAGLLGLLLLWGLAHAAAFEDFSQLHIHNTTGETLLYMFISPSASRSWGVDIVADDNGLASGERFAAFLPLSRQECLVYDLLGRSVTGSFYLLRGKELCGGWNELTLGAETLFESRMSMNLGRLTVHNDTGHDVLFLYTAVDRHELLGPSILRAGRQLRAFGTAEFLYAHEGLDVLYLWALDSGSGVHELRVDIDTAVDEYEIVLQADTRER
ncbi:MAG: hypothetical protein EA428_13580 [Spirochaetaceae bacterium]|nr:MAG: hypothetical protein EA428_13580 [Spirochaetaceae bacterium]